MNRPHRHFCQRVSGERRRRSLSRIRTYSVYCFTPEKDCYIWCFITQFIHARYLVPRNLINLFNPGLLDFFRKLQIPGINWIHQRHFHLSPLRIFILLYFDPDRYFIENGNRSVIDGNHVIFSVELHVTLEDDEPLKAESEGENVRDCKRRL